MCHYFNLFFFCRGHLVEKMCKSVTSTKRKLTEANVTFNERFVQCFAFCTQVLGTYLPVNWLTKSSSHTSLNLTNSGLVITTLGPNNFG